MSVISQLMHRTHAAASALRAAHLVAIAVISLALVAGSGVGQSLAYQQWINMLLMRDAAMLSAARSPIAKEEEGSALPTELQHRLESFLDLAEEAMSSKDKSADVTGDDDTEPQLRPSRHLPWLYAWNDKDYVVVPGDRAPKASLAARALEYNNAAALVGTDIPWEVVARHRAAARRLLRLLPDARTSRFEVYELAPPFAQALRINLLGPQGHA